jgi:thioredoxin 1
MPQRLLPAAEERALHQGAACIKFTASWCGPCRQIQPCYTKLAQQHAADVVCYVSDADAEAGFAAEAQVTGLPTFVFFADGTEVERVEGAREEALRAAFQRAAGRSRSTDLKVTNS